MVPGWFFTVPECFLWFFQVIFFGSRMFFNGFSRFQVGFSCQFRLRCDALSRRNPRWNITEHSGQAVGQVQIKILASANNIKLRKLKFPNKYETEIFHSFDYKEWVSVLSPSPGLMSEGRR